VPTSKKEVDGVRPIEASGRNTKERKELLDKLVEYGEKIGRLTVENARWKSHVMTINDELKRVTRVERSEQEMRRHLKLEKADVLAFQKRITKQLSQTRNQISRTKRRLED